MRLLAALVLPALFALVITFGATRVVGGAPTSARSHAHAVVWGKRTFASRAALGRWLRSRGRSYQAWARRHPVTPPVAKGRRSPSSDSTLVGGGIAVLGLAALAFLVRRRRRSMRSLVRRPALPRPRIGASYVRAQSATLLAWRQHPDLAWYVAGGALAVGAGLVVAGWG
jgi:MYXO-CTERM domain-containing protein